MICWHVLTAPLRQLNPEKPRIQVEDTMLLMKAQFLLGREPCWVQLVIRQRHLLCQGNACGRRTQKKAHAQVRLQEI